jgi:oligopeptide transport system substrate-binding protein
VYDMALDRALAEADPDKRGTLMRAAEAIVMDDMPILPLYYYSSRALVRPEVTGWRDNDAHVHPSRTLGLRKP